MPGRARRRRAHAGPWRLVVADNASTGGSVTLVERLHPEATVVRLPRNLGDAAGVNALLGERSGRTSSLGETVTRGAAYARPVTTDWAAEVDRACIGSLEQALLEEAGRLFYANHQLLKLCGARAS